MLPNPFQDAGEVEIKRDIVARMGHLCYWFARPRHIG